MNEALTIGVPCWQQFRPCAEATGHAAKPGAAFQQQMRRLLGIGPYKPSSSAVISVNT
jgi:hypothetical protein